MTSDNLVNGTFYSSNEGAIQHVLLTAVQIQSVGVRERERLVKLAYCSLVSWFTPIKFPESAHSTKNYHCKANAFTLHKNTYIYICTCKVKCKKLSQSHNLPSVQFRIMKFKQIVYSIISNSNESPSWNCKGELEYAIIHHHLQRQSLNYIFGYRYLMRQCSKCN